MHGLWAGPGPASSPYPPRVGDAMPRSDRRGSVAGACAPCLMILAASFTGWIRLETTASAMARVPEPTP